MTKKANFGGGIISGFFKSPGKAIVALVLVYVGIQFLQTAIASGGVLDLLMNGIEGLLNSTGYTTLATMFASGGTAFLLIGAGIVGGAIYLISSGSRR